LINLSKNARGVYSIDTIMGCYSGTKDNKRGCYNDCYATNYARRYGYDFGHIVRRGFKGIKHPERLVNQINKMDMPFVRIGTSGDPSEDWEHTLYILEALVGIEKPIVIITKHWYNMSEEQLTRLFCLNVHVNTSVSALDDPDILENGLHQFKRLKPFCNSRLRIVTCDFNISNTEGRRLQAIQDKLVKTDGYIDTVFRASSKNNPLITQGIINTKISRFMNKKMLVSKSEKNPYLGKCEKCPEMCGVTM
jgi:hypothetical protein